MLWKFTDIRKFQIETNNESNLTDKMPNPYINDKIECLFVYVVNLIICKHGHFSVQKYQTGINSTRLRFCIFARRLHIWPIILVKVLRTTKNALPVRPDCFLMFLSNYLDYLLFFFYHKTFFFYFCLYYHQLSWISSIQQFVKRWKE